MPGLRARVTARWGTALYQPARPHPLPDVHRYPTLTLYLSWPERPSAPPQAAPVGMMRVAQPRSGAYRPWLVRTILSGYGSCWCSTWCGRSPVQVGHALRCRSPKFGYLDARLARRTAGCNASTDHGFDAIAVAWLLVCWTAHPTARTVPDSFTCMEGTRPTSRSVHATVSWLDGLSGQHR